MIPKDTPAGKNSAPRKNIPSLEKALQKQKTIRVLGIDDAPFDKNKDKRVHISGIICSNTRFEGMLCSEADIDGCNATDVLTQMVMDSKFYDQIHLILIDGLAVGGFNVIDLQSLSNQTGLPCVAVMRSHPNLDAVDKALQNVPHYQNKADLLKKAGQIYQQEGFVFQLAGCSPLTASLALKQLTDRGKVPEALRLAHLIGSAIKTGQSSNRA